MYKAQADAQQNGQPGPDADAGADATDEGSDVEDVDFEEVKQPVLSAIEGQTSKKLDKHCYSEFISDS